MKGSRTARGVAGDPEDGLSWKRCDPPDDQYLPDPCPLFTLFPGRGCFSETHHLFYTSYYSGGADRLPIACSWVNNLSLEIRSKQ
jgi:hypothetical protein